MSTNKTKQICLAIIIGVIAFVLTLLSEMSLATDSSDSSSSGTTTNTEVISEMTTTSTDGDREITSYTSLGTADGKELYCIQHGTYFEGVGGTLDIETALQYGGIDGSIVTWAQTHAYHREFEHDGERTYPVLYCTGNHVELADTDPALAYIVTYPTLGEWSEEKQYAVWGSDYAASAGSASASSSISGEADSYADFFEKTSTAEGATTTDTRIAEEDLTDEDDIIVAVDYTEQTLVIGPFSIDYIYGAYEDTGVAFGGISDMYLIGYNSSGEVVQERIEIEKYIYNDEEYDLEFFEPDDSYVDYSEQSYPKGVSAGEDEFYVKISNPNADATGDADSVKYVSLHIEFKWMSASAYICHMDGHVYEVSWDHEDSTHYHDETPCYYCTAYSWLEDIEVQDHMNVLNGTRKLYQASLDICLDTPIDITMELGGIVWEDAVTTKESIADGVSNTEGDVDIRLPNVKVTLYDEDGNVVELLADEDSASGDEIYHCVNPTYTDENGEYLFTGLDPLKKYYVVFEYNGQRYLPTEYLNTADGQYTSVEQMVNAELYNTDEWEVTSKGTEAEEGTSVTGVEITRDEFDERFSEITAYPENYPSSNSLGVVGEYNATFTQRDLMGYTLDEDGYYQKTGTQLVDGYEYDENGNETTTYSEGIISQKVREYIESNKEFPDDSAMLEIYTEIANSAEDSDEMWMMLQFIEDCQIQAYSGSPFTQEIDYYPVYDQFYINDSEDGETYDTSVITIGGVDYYPIYPGQYYVNLGLWRRQEYDAALRKDVFKAALKINGKTITYDYDKRAEENEDSTNSEDGQDNDTYWDINVRMSDYENYYGIGYNRDLYESDYDYDDSEHPGDPLSVYVTYQIAVTNQSMSIETKIKELVDYYDEEYTYKAELSWATLSYYKNTNETVTENYYNMMANSQTDLDNGAISADDYMSIDDDDYLYADMSESEANRSSTNKTLEGFNNLYLHSIEDLQLETGETVYLYLTFQVNYDEDDKLIVDNQSDDDTPKYNIVEINGYETYYRDGTVLPNGVEKNSDDIAGLLDRDSNPGNLEQEDLEGEKYEKNFEDDTDEAPPLNINLIDEERQLNGYVWEDERTDEVEGSLVGDGIMQDDETKIAGVTVQLWELCTDGETIWVWDETTTDENGYYEFDGFIPGDYVVHFIYGENDDTALSTESLGRTGLNIVSYNGQDYKSTTYQEGIEQEGYTDIDETYEAYTDTANQNEGIYTQTDSSYYYGYDIYATDLETDAGNNYSDAKDIWSRREAVISYSDTDVTNHVAEVLASPYEVPEYNGTAYTEEEMSALYDELEENTYMEAETGIIVMEIEYNRQTTDGDDDVVNDGETSSQDSYIDDNGQNGNYVVRNVDLGLEERPKSQLEISKEVTNITVTLVNNTVLFDINAEADNALWTDHNEYNVGAIKDEYDGIYPTYYDSETAYPKGTENANLYYHRYSYRDIINDQIVPSTDKGLIQLTMDEELMQGATIQITYSIKVTNVGEVDYVDDETKEFYYLGEYTGSETISETVTNQVIDYVQNNLRFDESATNNAYNAINDEEDTERMTNSENGWAVIEKSEITSEGLVNERLSEQIDTFIDVIQTESFSEKALTPGESITKTLLLSQQISSQNTSDDLSYGNMVEIVKTSNTVGRRMAYSTVGNQNPTDSDAGEIDANIAETVVILPPFGEDRFTYLIGFVIGAILITGIVLIRRKVLGNGGNDKPSTQEG